jgi:branched-chain amino acid transport system substrate-binding protein
MRADVIRRLLVTGALAVLVTLVVTSCGGGTRGTIRIGIYGDCWGPFTTGNEERIAGAELPFIRRGAKPRGSDPSDGVGSVTIAGKRVELVTDCEFYGSLTSELATVRRLVAQQGVDILVTPNNLPDIGEVLDPPHQPGVTFISTGLIPAPPRPNLFRVAMSLRQASAGLGAYAYNTLGWRTAVTFGEDDFLGWGLTSGFVAEFCSLGGTVVHRFWGPAEIANWSRLVRQTPRGVDGVAVFNGIQSSKTFFSAYRKLQPDIRRHLVMSATAIAEAFPDIGQMTGITTAGFLPFVGGPVWTSYLRAFQAAFPRYRGPIGSPVDVYAFDAVELALEAIARVHGDLSGGERRLRAVLPALLPQVQTPGGTLHFDRNRHAAGPNYLIRVEKAANGKLVPRTVGVVPNVDESFGGYFTANSPPDSETEPVCRKGHVPAWAR